MYGSCWHGTMAVRIFSGNSTNAISYKYPHLDNEKRMKKMTRETIAKKVVSATILIIFWLLLVISF